MKVLRVLVATLVVAMGLCFQRADAADEREHSPTFQRLGAQMDDAYAGAAGRMQGFRESISDAARVRGAAAWDSLGRRTGVWPGYILAAAALTMAMLGGYWMGKRRTQKQLKKALKKQIE
ncbi:hypothetical protein NCLIV_023110 [Neospora caninum Liverpool]|uniref:Transmembrane protein n=1 Tax=Neospora caninum (strain Liverpool) TaxID=572307 RepID=F0VFM9_NEOCL|nr:hypothetical protein NCLIV_023110 [Neospora caninum Liverpool]CBZ52523.1 hypothetical protein NCLIV_023110 [Neospora caninum Liverpool]CEL66500.1 TPA: hypothetical protein BN1204_023110 [Neospora caninum Liverpool]|eukprot:XP_003882555.1 hypothetical protein NCLIV_023110 [Neospora caninum Liverpool]